MDLSRDLELVALSKREASEKYYKIKSLKGKFNFTDHILSYLGRFAVLGFRSLYTLFIPKAPILKYPKKNFENV